MRIDLSRDFSTIAAVSGTDVDISIHIDPGFIAAADTIDVVTTISGSPGIITGRVWALVVDCGAGTRAAASVDRDQLA